MAAGTTPLRREQPTVWGLPVGFGFWEYCGRGAKMDGITGSYSLTIVQTLDWGRLHRLRGAWSVNRRHPAWLPTTCTSRADMGRCPRGIVGPSKQSASPSRVKSQTIFVVTRLKP